MLHQHACVSPLQYVPCMHTLTLLLCCCRWDEDVVFKNQTRGEVKAPRRFINDTVRSDFHRKFLERYIK